MTSLTKREAFAYLEERGIKPSEDRLDRLRSNGFHIGFRPSIADARTVEISYDNLVALEALLRLHQKLCPRNARYRELAFWHAWNGYPAPPALVVEHMDQSIEAFGLLCFRVFCRFGSRQHLRVTNRRLREVKAGGIEASTIAFGRRLVRWRLGRETGTKSAALTLVAATAASIILLSASRGKVDAVVRCRAAGLLRGLVRDPEVDSFTNSLSMLLYDVVPIFMPRDANIYRARLPYECEPGYEAITRAIDGAKVLIPSLRALVPAFDTRWLGDELWVRNGSMTPASAKLSRAIIPIAVAVIHAMWDSGVEERIDRVRRGDTAELEERLAILRDLRDKMLTLFSPGASR